MRNVSCSDDHAFSLLHWAAKAGHAGIVDLLLARGARINATNMGDDTSLHLAASHGHRPIVVKLLQKKAEVNASNEHGMTPLHYACFWGYEQIAEDLIRAGGAVNVCNKRNLTPLDVCQPQVRQTIYGVWLSNLVSHYIPSEIAIENGQDVQQKIPFRDETWRNTKTRTRDATLSRYTGVDIQSLVSDQNKKRLSYQLQCHYYTHCRSVLRL